MKFTEKYTKAFQYLLPSPLSIAFLLTFLTFIIAYIVTDNVNSEENYFITLLGYWEKGLWNSNLLVFALQMMLILVLGHILALTPFVSKSISALVNLATTTSKAATIVTFFTILVSLFNWGLGLIFGAIICRSIGENARIKNIPMNYPLIGAAGYSGFMVWHGGISGSATTKVAEAGHLRTLLSGNSVTTVPNSINFSETVFSSMNITASIMLLILLPTLMYILGKQKKAYTFPEQLPAIETKKENSSLIGA